MTASGKAKIAVVIRSLTGGGMERVALALARGFAAKGHQVDLLVGVGEGGMRSQVPETVRLCVLEASPHLCARLRLLATAPAEFRDLVPLVVGHAPRMHRHLAAMSRYLREDQPDALLANGTQSNLITLWARHIASTSTRIVVSEHSTLSQVVRYAKRGFREAYPRLIRKAYPAADAVVAVSDGVADDLAAVADLKRSSITTIYDPVVFPEMEERSRAPVDHPWMADTSVPVILAVGRLHRDKDFALLLRAFARVRASQRARLVVLGEGDQRALLEGLARELGVAQDVALPGFQSNPYAWMARASVLALTSRREGLPGVLIEAMACGCPVVSTDCPSGPAEILENGTFGRIVAMGDDGALAAAICSALAAPREPDRLRERAGLFSVSTAVDRYLDVLLQGGGRAS